MKHSHKCDECRKEFDCPYEEISKETCEAEELPICEDCW